MSLAKELSSWCVLVVWNCGKPWDHLGIFPLEIFHSLLFFFFKKSKEILNLFIYL